MIPSMKEGGTGLVNDGSRFEGVIDVCHLRRRSSNRRRTLRYSRKEGFKFVPTQRRESENNRKLEE